MLSFGFETSIKANSPLVNRPNHVSIRRCFKSDKLIKLVLSFQLYKEYQTGRWCDILVCIFVPKIIIVCARMCIGSWIQALGLATANAWVPKRVTEEQTTSRPGIHCGTETWPDLRLKSTPSRPPSTWLHSTWLDFTWQWHVTESTSNDFTSSEVMMNLRE